MTCPTGHPYRASGAVTGQGGQRQSEHVPCMGDENGAGVVDSDGVGALGSGSNSESGRSGAGSDTGVVDLEEQGNVDDGTALCQGMHYYVDVPHSEESAYAACERNVQIDSEFHHHLQEESGTADISRFLALPEIIPARQRRRQQPLLDFTKSKILTSHAYIESYKRVLAQKEATQAEAKLKAEIREATKETRR